MAPDPLAAELTAIEQRHEELRSRYGHVGGLLVLAKAQNDVPRLLAAVEAVLALHRRANGWRSVCRTCCNAAGEMVRWPCSTYLAVTRELLSEEADRG
jgi:hypothetical protein